MADRLGIGQRILVVWQANKNSKASPVCADRYKTDPAGSTQRASKIILPTSDFAPRVGEQWLCEVVRESKPREANKGCLFVRGITATVTLDLGADFWVDKQVAAEIIHDLKDRVNIMLVGPQGCGKTELVRRIAVSLGYEFQPINCTIVRRNSDWFGTRGIKNGETTWTDAKLTQALREAAKFPQKIFVIFLDELNRCPMDARNGILGIVYGEVRSADLPTGESITVGDNIQFVAAINEGNEFGGILGMDAAFADRWVRHKISYPPFDEEVRILGVRFPNVDKNYSRYVVKAANALRDAFRRGDVAATVSMRSTQNAVRRMAHGISLERAITTGILNQYQGDPSDAGSDAAAARNIVSGVGNFSPDLSVYERRTRLLTKAP